MANKDMIEEVPEFDKNNNEAKSSELDISGAVSGVSIHGWKQIVGIIAVAVIVLGGLEALIRYFDVPGYVLPTPSAIFTALVISFPVVWPHFLYTIASLISGFAIGATIGFILAAVLTQIPFLEKIITPYIILIITTPAIALVPLLMLRLGFGMGPRIVVIALASGPMVMINAVTGFRRTDLAKIALAKSYGASLFQIFWKIRVPLALPMINVGLLVGGIFGLITAVGADMIGGREGLGNRLAYYSALARTDNFFAVIILIAIIGISIWIGITFFGKKYASWRE